MFFGGFEKNIHSRLFGPPIAVLSPSRLVSCSQSRVFRRFPKRSFLRPFAFVTFAAGRPDFVREIQNSQEEVYRYFSTQAGGMMPKRSFAVEGFFFCEAGPQETRSSHHISGHTRQIDNGRIWDVGGVPPKIKQNTVGSVYGGTQRKFQKTRFVLCVRVLRIDDSPHPTSPNSDMSRRLSYQEVEGSGIDKDHVYMQKQTFHLFQPDYSSAGNSDLGECRRFFRSHQLCENCFKAKTFGDVLGTAFLVPSHESSGRFGL